jgi:hypothetical protein
MFKILTIRLGHEIYFDVDGVRRDLPLDWALFDECQGGNPMLFYTKVAEWASLNRITHIIDENLLEMGIRDLDNIEIPITIREYSELAREFLEFS